jgi:hypothetical protein
MKRFLGNFRARFKFNFGPQHLSSKLSYFVNIRRHGILLLVTDQEVIPPRDKTNLALGGFIIILVIVLLLHHPVDGKCLIRFAGIQCERQA